MAVSLGTRPIRVLIADDQTLFRSGLARLLTEVPDIKVVAVAGDGAEAVRRVDERSPDVVLMDVKMRTLGGIEATRLIVSKHPSVRVLILATIATDTHVVEALRAGAAGYILKDSALSAVASSIRAVVASGSVISNTVIDQMLAMIGSNGGRSEDGLTPREMEVLKLIARGMPNKQVAFQLKISDKTVRNHLCHIYEKLEIFDRAQLVLYAVRKGLVDL
jgi:DNA-binding NarL/FixJ family response regulator